MGDKKTGKLAQNLIFGILFLCFVPTFAANLSKEVSFIVKDLDAVGSVVTDEDLLPIVDNHSVGKLEVLRATKLVQHVAKLVKDDHPHHLEQSM